jgi:hypothetical protein
MSGNDASFSAFGVYVGADWTVLCHHYPGKTPILSVDAGGSALTVSIKGRDADQAAVDFARTLLKQVQAFTADIERLHAESTVPTATDTAGQAA